jgi:hypothetical protein
LGHIVDVDKEVWMARFEMMRQAQSSGAPIPQLQILPRKLLTKTPDDRGGNNVIWLPAFRNVIQFPRD